MIGWLGFGFFELWLGRVFLRAPYEATGAPLIRIIYQSDVVVFVATLAVFAAGVLQTIVFDWGWFSTLWLGLKQSIMFGVLIAVALILPRALRLGALVNDLPEGPGPASKAVVDAYRALEPWYWSMRLAGLAAVFLAVFKPS